MKKIVYFEDKPFEHVLKCLPNSDDPAGNNRKEWETMMCGKLVTIDFPQIERVAPQHENYICQGPFYWQSGKDTATCIHIIDWLRK